MRFAVVAHGRSGTNDALVRAAGSLGATASVLSPRDALRILEPGDVALARLDVREALDGIEEGESDIERLADAAARRVAADGEWRTNVSLGGASEPVAPPPIARRLALAAAAPIRGGLVGVDLLPTATTYVISEVNGAVDFRPWYGLGLEGVYDETILELLRVARLRAATRLVSA